MHVWYWDHQQSPPQHQCKLQSAAVATEHQQHHEGCKCLNHTCLLKGINKEDLDLVNNIISSHKLLWTCRANKALSLLQMIGALLAEMLFMSISSNQQKTTFRYTFETFQITSLYSEKQIETLHK